MEYTVSNVQVTKHDLFLFLQRTYKDTSNFDTVFTKETMKMTPTDSQLLMNVSHKTMFGGFSYVNPKFVPRE